MEERVSGINLNVSFLQETAQVSAHRVNIQTQMVSEGTTTFFHHFCVTWGLKCMKTHYNLMTSAQIHKHEQTMKPATIDTHPPPLKKPLFANELQVLKYCFSPLATVQHADY